MQSQPKDWNELIGDTFLNQDKKVGLETIQNVKNVGIYFSASWCPPCHKFTPKLAEAYKEVNKTAKVLEIVFVSSDHKLDDYNEYRKIMPWIALPYESTEKKEFLSGYYKVEGIPTLVILNSNREIKCPDAYEDVGDNGAEGLRKHLL